MAGLTGMVILTSIHIYVLNYSTYTRVPGSVSIQNLSTLVLAYKGLLALLVYLTEARWL